MEEQENKYLNSLSKKVMKNSAIESPSFNFTDAVMSRVNTLPESKAIIYKPLISKTAWLLIGCGVLAMVVYILSLGTKSEMPNWLQSLDFSALSNVSFNLDLPTVSISKTVVYSILFLGLMICVQIPLLKNHFDKRFEV